MRRELSSAARKTIMRYCEFTIRLNETVKRFQSLQTQAYANATHNEFSVFTIFIVYATPFLR